jgi:23S rRNA G2069 N7-methylase RlmK/C1962 C5-methylase RlmI
LQESDGVGVHADDEQISQEQDEGLDEEIAEEDEQEEDDGFKEKAQLKPGDRSAEFRDVIVEEDGLKYHVDLRTSALSSGLFLDQR